MTSALAWRPSVTVTVPVPPNEHLLCSRLGLALSSQTPLRGMQPAGRERQPRHRLAADMGDPFPDGAFVRLRNRVQETYLHADDDGVSVSLCAHGREFPLTAVWRVHRVMVQGSSLVLLQSAAHGRYLATTPDDAPPGYRGRSVVQRDFDGDDLGALMWRGIRVIDAEQYVRVRHELNHNLRANGRYCIWRNIVTVDSNGGRHTTMMHWTVETLPRAPALPQLRTPTTDSEKRRGLFQRRARPEEDRRRFIRHVRANDEGDYDQNHENWDVFPFLGRSVFNLRAQVGMRSPGGDMLGITLAVRPGYHGRLTPVLNDLHRCEDTMYIISFTSGSEGAEELAYPVF